MLRSTLLHTHRRPLLAVAHSAHASPTPLFPPAAVCHRYHVAAAMLPQAHSSRTAALLRLDDPRRPLRQPTPSHDIQRVMRFHVSAPRQGWPLVGLLAGFLKTSVALEYARMAARIALTFVPVVVLKNHAARKYLRHVIGDQPEMETKRAQMENRIRQRSIFNKALIIFPLVIFGFTLLASLERTPLSGRWRLILLSPEEEDEIANQLAGVGWYNAIGEILSQEGPISILSPTDWRYQWVLQTLRRLETTVPLLCKEKYDEECNQWLLRNSPEDPPLPPPPAYPLRARPTAREMLHMFCDMICDQPATPAPHVVPGPPYSLVVVEKPDCANAFSFGFGPNGGGGIVVYSGFLDQVLSQYRPAPEPVEKPSQGLLSSLFGGLFSTPSRPQTLPADYPTHEQTSQLAILLAHELSHLILSHHLETLSSGTVIVPGTISMIADILRAILFPVTMLFGPFVNDAVANIGKIGTGEFAKLSEYCTTVKQEFEADAVSARILAISGFDARDAVRFWQERGDRASECSSKRAQDKADSRSFFFSLPDNIWTTHPVGEKRIEHLKKELERWEEQRKKALEEMAKVQSKLEVQR